jgi:hypothetical protein
MKRYLPGLVALSVVLSLLTGCATTDGGRTREEGTGFGALLGAAIGAGAGALIGGKNGALLGTGIGTALGAGAGYVAGNAVADKKAQYVDTEDQMDGQINSVVQTNENLREYNDQTTTRIADLDKEVTHLKSRLKAKKVKATEIEAKKKEIKLLIQVADQHKSEMNKEVVALNKYIKSIDHVQDRNKMAKLGQEVDLLKKSIALLDNNSVQMAKMLKSLSVRK